MSLLFNRVPHNHYLKPVAMECLADLWHAIQVAVQVSGVYHGVTPGQISVGGTNDHNFAHVAAGSARSEGLCRAEETLGSRTLRRSEATKANLNSTKHFNCFEMHRLFDNPFHSNSLNP